MADSILRDKAKEFAKEIVFACRDMKNNKKESVLINQLLRSATSIGANIHEAQYAQGTKDFISKFEITLKKQVKQDIGSNCSIGQNILMSRLSKCYLQNAFL